jgi:hypothetical protein
VKKNSVVAMRRDVFLFTDLLARAKVIFSPLPVFTDLIGPG